MKKDRFYSRSVNFAEKASQSKVRDVASRVPPDQYYRSILSPVTPPAEGIVVKQPIGASRLSKASTVRLVLALVSSETAYSTVLYIDI